jgi:hypothetical protein
METFDNIKHARLFLSADGRVMPSTYNKISFSTNKKSVSSRDWYRRRAALRRAAAGVPTQEVTPCH